MEEVRVEIGLDRGVREGGAIAGAKTGAAAQAVAIGERHGNRLGERAVIDIARDIGELAERIQIESVADVEFVTELEAAADRSGIEISRQRTLLVGHGQEIGLHQQIGMEATIEIDQITADAAAFIDDAIRHVLDVDIGADIGAEQAGDTESPPRGPRATPSTPPWAAAML